MRWICHPLRRPSLQEGGTVCTPGIIVCPASSLHCLHVVLYPGPFLDVWWQLEEGLGCSLICWTPHRPHALGIAQTNVHAGHGLHQLQSTRLQTQLYKHHRCYLLQHSLRAGICKGRRSAAQELCQWLLVILDTWVLEAFDSDHAAHLVWIIDGNHTCGQ